MLDLEKLWNIFQISVTKNSRKLFYGKGIRKERKCALAIKNQAQKKAG